MNGLTHMTRFLMALLGGLLAVSAPALAQSARVAVVELYTSQGCSSCPPADALLGKLTQDARVIPLALHVEYWDYLGWKDKFASKQYSDRQRAYAHAIGDNMIYTPQMVISGQERIVGSKAPELEAAIRNNTAKPTLVGLVINRSGARVQIEAQALQGAPRVMLVQLVRYRPSQEVAIKRGENAGRTVTYHNIVTSWQQVAEWDSSAPLSIEAAAEGTDPVVVILQAPGPKEVIAAAAIR